MNTPKKGGGVCCYTNTSYNFSATELSTFNESTRNGEIQCILLGHDYMKKIVVINIYRPPQGNVETFVENLSRKTDSISTLFPNCELIILGDFDINYNDKNNVNTRHLK